VGGCWALRITLTDRNLNNFNYYGIIDTGSPFLTSPPSLAMKEGTTATTKPTNYPTTLEQYGEATGDMIWRKAYSISLLSGMGGQLVEQQNVVLGVASPSVIQEAGGIYVGLIRRDDNRPTFLQQFGYRNFGIDFRAPSSSILFSRGRLIEKQDPEALELFDLQPYGPDLYHYGVLVERLEFTIRSSSNASKSERTSSKEIIPASALQRPVVAILDTGLTGCICSDSLYQELFGSRSDSSSAIIEGATVTLPTVGGKAMELSSLDKYWRFSSFRLPWFDDDERHPHIIALGSTFWANTDSLVIDVDSQRAKIIPTDK
jgi:hypothetical protein